MAKFGDRLSHAWNAFVKTDNLDLGYDNSAYGTSLGSLPSRSSFRPVNERTIVQSIYTRIGIDVASVKIRHVRTDDNERYLEEIPSGLNECLRLEANIDQAATAFRLDLMANLFDTGVAALVPVDTTLNPETTGGYDIKTMRVGQITQWYPNHVRVSVYNEKIGKRQEVILEKKVVAIIVNPLYSVMNEPNSTLQRLIRKLNLLDVVDEQSGSGKLDIIIQLPYVIKSEARRVEAERRRRDIEMQLKGSQYGIAYSDATEKITQLNRPAENNLLKQVEYLTGLLYSQLGLTEEVMNGTADEAAMLNYHNRTIAPILDAILEEMNRKFLTKTARTQNQAIQHFRDPFKLVPLSQIAEIADKLTRNEILSSNEVRSVIGFMPSSDPKADELRNSNMPQPMEETVVAEDGSPEQDDAMMSAFDEMDSVLDEVFNDLGVEE